MSFKNKLVLFFIAIVIFPLAITSVLIIRASGEINKTRNDAALEKVIEVSGQVYKKEREKANKRAEELSENIKFRQIWAEPNSSKKLKRFFQKRLSKTGIVAASGYKKEGQIAWRIGERDAIGSVRIYGPGKIESIEISEISPTDLVAQLKNITQAEFIIAEGKRELASSIKKNDLVSPYQQKAFKIRIYQNKENTKIIKVIALVPKETGSFVSNRPVLIVIFIALILLAIIAAILLQKSMRREISKIAEVTGEISAGNFDKAIEVQGKDELSALAGEINKMSSQIKNQIDALKKQSSRLEKVFGLLGETMSSTLDRDRLLSIISEVALELSQSEVVQLKYREDTYITKFRSGKNEKYLEALQNTKDVSVFSQPTQIQENGISIIKETIKEQGADAEVASLYLARPRVYSQAEIDIISSIALSASLSLNNISLHEQLAKMAITDDLTSLTTRARMEAVLEKEIKRAERFSHPLSLMMIDVDDFKKLNDEYGHLDGDRVLKKIAHEMQNQARDVDEVARFGGEEFVIILPETKKDNAFDLGERIRKTIEAIDFNTKGQVTVSIGIAEFEKGDDSKAILKKADEALYSAKRSGKNQVILNDS